MLEYQVHSHSAGGYSGNTQDFMKWWICIEPCNCLKCEAL